MLDINEIQTIEHDVVIIGAGGAGIRAAIECAQMGMNTGMISKSLLGKAHTVMAEGGMAAALGNVDPRDNWKIHFRDTMRGGKFLNQWRMAELHARQAPNRVNELEDMGAVFDRTKEGLINQRNFGGHRYPRLAHVGDRTGLEMISAKVAHVFVGQKSQVTALATVAAVGTTLGNILQPSEADASMATIPRLELNFGLVVEHDQVDD